MGRWLSRVQTNDGNLSTAIADEKNHKSASHTPPKTPERSLVGLGGCSQGAFTEKKATADQVEVMLANLRAVGRDLGEVEPLARTVMRNLTRAAAAELVAVLDDLFETAPTPDVARSQCQRVLNDPRALEATKAVWPDLATLPVEQPDNAVPVIEHPATWYNFIKQQCPLSREDELYLLRCLSSLSNGEAMQAARLYVAAWHQAADAEPTPHRKDNAGRRAANQSLRGNRHAG